MKKFIYGVFLPLLVLVNSTTQAAPILSLGEHGTSNNHSGLYVYGWQFDALEDMTISMLGLYDQGGDGLLQSHEVGVWDANGTLLTSLETEAGENGLLIGNFRYFDIVPLNLQKDMRYVLGATSWSQDYYAFNVSDFDTDDGIRYLSPVHRFSGGELEFPTGSGNSSIFNINLFRTEAVDLPEPQSMFMLVMGLGIMLMLRRKRAIKS